MACSGLDILGRKTGQVLVAAHHHLANHAGQAHLLAILGAVNTRYPIGMQLADFRRHNHAAAAAKHLDVRAAPAFKQVHHVFEILDVSALIRTDGDALRVFLQGGGDNLVNAAVVSQMNHFCAHALQDAPHDVDGRVVPVKQTGSRHKTHLVLRAVAGQRLVLCR